ncbi:MAG: hypothetical protein ASUL_07884 [Candidatus Aramenus sulfurataquae]|uniref:Uncharacterized protein n=1 Tax=Candidatus Aramenus sulfurataquae TaxID=1326980 RepID=W7KU10_9CREN|nr:MAG: hypothetical protein ASUL_07884 [Candidatus Aramenus sulfurataquae]
MVKLSLDDDDLVVLEHFVSLPHLTSYKFSKLTKIPNATAWRLFLKLAELGLIKKSSKGFAITPRGVVLTYIFTAKKNVKANCLKLLKELWRYGGSEEELGKFIDDFYKVITSAGISPFIVCFNQPITIAMMMYNRLNEVSEDSKKVIAEMLLNYFSPVEVNGCRVLISYDGEGRPYAIAAKCRKEGIKLNYYCSEIEKIVGKVNATLPRGLR